MFRQSAILLCFVFFCLYTTGSVAIQTFAAPALHAAYDISMSIATSAVTAYLLGSTAGIVAGGVLASRTMHHDRVAAIGLATGASALALCAAFPVKPEWVLPLFVVGGFALGSTGPSRDMIVRKATPQGASGRTYGFVYSGFDLGATLGPVLAGSLIDAGAPRLVFAAIAFFLVLALGTVLQAERARPLAAVATRAGD